MHVLAPAHSTLGIKHLSKVVFAVAAAFHKLVFSWPLDTWPRAGPSGAFWDRSVITRMSDTA